MVGNVTAVTAAPARTSVPSEQAPAALAGKIVSSGGKDLPAAHQSIAAADLEAAVRKLNAAMAASQRNLSFRIDEGTGRTVITVLDATTKEVIRQIPSEEVLAMSQQLAATGSFIDARA
jgi:flagellar protein FlaG